MKYFIVHAHAEEKSFNGALTQLAQKVLTENAHEVIISDLYKMGFNPVSDRRNFLEMKEAEYFKQQVEELHATETNTFAPDIQAEMEKLFWCDVLIFQFPLWWFGLPSILKGWVDKVFAMGKIYGLGKFYDRGVFAGKKAMLSLTTGGGSSMYGPDGLNGDIAQVLYPINHGIFRFVGFDVLPPFIAWAPIRADEETRKKYLSEYKEKLLTVGTAEPIQYPSLDQYDEQFKLKNV